LADSPNPEQVTPTCTPKREQQPASIKSTVIAEFTDIGMETLIWMSDLVSVKPFKNMDVL
jgi:hypothetical protein